MDYVPHRRFDSLNRYPDAAKADAFEAVTQAQSSAQSQKLGKRAIILDKVAGDIAALASWKSASHVEAPPKKKAPPTP